MIPTIGADPEVIALHAKLNEAREVLAQIEARIMRLEAGPIPDSVIELGDVRIDAASLRVLHVSGAQMRLTRQQAAMLLTMMRGGVGRVWSPDQLLTATNSHATPASVKVVISHLRRPLEGSRLRIKNIFGVGYMLEVMK